MSNPSTHLCFRCRFSETHFHIQALFRPVKTTTATQNGTTKCASAVSTGSTATYPGGSHVRHTMFRYAVLVSQLAGFGKFFNTSTYNSRFLSAAIRVKTTLTTQCENCSFSLFTWLFRKLNFPLPIEYSIRKLCKWYSQTHRQSKRHVPRQCTTFR